MKLEISLRPPTQCNQPVGKLPEGGGYSADGQGREKKATTEQRDTYIHNRYVYIHMYLPSYLIPRVGRHHADAYVHTYTPPSPRRKIYGKRKEKKKEKKKK